MCDGEQYSCKDGVFRLPTTGTYRVARVYHDKQYVSLKLQELQHLLNMFYVSQGQLETYACFA
jgi:hypothetical protein